MPLNDKRQKFTPAKFTFSCKLFDFQKAAVNSFRDQEHGLLVAPSGSGKTIMGLALIAKKRQPALIVVHRKQIYNQWLERIEHFLGIPRREIGQFTSAKKSLNPPITVAMVQTLSRLEDLSELNSSFGFVLVDECHHMPARMFRQVITQFNPQYLYGLTATPERKNNDAKLIFIYLGDIIHEIPRDYNQISKQKATRLEVLVQDTNLSLPFSVRIDDFQFLSKVLVFDSKRNQLIARDIKKKAKEGHRCLVLTERKEHVEILSYYLKRDFEIITLTGDLTLKKRLERVKQIKSGNFQILIATGQLMGEGTDFDNLDCLFLVYPFAFEGKLTQYIGRIQHGKGKIKTIYDYRDKKIEFLEKLFEKRNRYYNKLRAL